MEFRHIIVAKNAAVGRPRRIKVNPPNRRTAVLCRLGCILVPRPQTTQKPQAPAFYFGTPLGANMATDRLRVGPALAPLSRG